MMGWRFPDSSLNNKMRCGPSRNACSVVLVQFDRNAFTVSHVSAFLLLSVEWHEGKQTLLHICYGIIMTVISMQISQYMAATVRDRQHLTKSLHHTLTQVLQLYSYRLHVIIIIRKSFNLPISFPVFYS